MGFDLSKIKKRLDAIKGTAEGLTAEAGWLPSAVYEDGTPVAYVAAIQEHGAPERSIPPRPFISETIEKNSDAWVKEASTALKVAATTGRPATAAADLIGVAMASDIQKTIAEGGFDDLKGITLMIRKMKDEHKGDPSWHMSGAKVGEAAARVEAGEPGSSRTKPLNDTGFLIATVIGRAAKS